MTKTLCALAAATVLGVGLTVTAVAADGQSVPNMAGTWRMDEARSGSPGHQTFVGPVVRVVRQTPQQIVIDLTRGGGDPMTLTYPLSESQPVRRTGEARANLGYWDGDALVTETVMNIQGQTVTSRETCRLQNNGTELVVERIVEVEHGYTLQGAQNYSAVKDIFVRAAPQD